MSEPMKGPYVAMLDGLVWYVHADGGQAIAEVYAYKSVGRSTAHLLAASWDMREALQYAVDNPNFDSETFDTFARAALAKARGEAQ